MTSNSPSLSIPGAGESERSGDNALSASLTLVGAFAVLNNRRRIRARIVREEEFTGNLGSNFLTKDRFVPSHMLKPKPPCSSVKVPTESLSIFFNSSTLILIGVRARADGGGFNGLGETEG